MVNRARVLVWWKGAHNTLLPWDFLAVENRLLVVARRGWGPVEGGQGLRVLAGPAAPHRSHGEQTPPGIVCFTSGTALTLQPGHRVLLGEKTGTSSAYGDSVPNIKFSGTHTLPTHTAVPNRATSINYYVYSVLHYLRSEFNVIQSSNNANKK